MPVEDMRLKWLLVVWGDVEPDLLGPYMDGEARDKAAVELKRAHGDDNGIFMLDAEGLPEVGAYSGGFFSGALGEDDDDDESDRRCY